VANEEDVTFASLGVADSLCKVIESIGWARPTEIQRNAIPEAIAGRDIIGLAETGSGKTGAFAIPILQALLSAPQRLFAVVLAPTRELAFQINEVFEALGATIALNSACIVGGIDMTTQAIALAKKPHVIVATPGRLVDHLENTKGFNLRNLKYLVMDEADRMLSEDFEEEINKILAVIPRERRTCLFSATMTSKVAKLQKASLVDPVKVEVSNKFQTPKVRRIGVHDRCDCAAYGLYDGMTSAGVEESATVTSSCCVCLTVVSPRPSAFFVAVHLLSILVFIAAVLCSSHVTSDAGAAIPVYPGQVQRLLPGVSVGRVQGPDHDHLRGHVQQRAARHGTYCCCSCIWRCFVALCRVRFRVVCLASSGACNDGARDRLSHMYCSGIPLHSGTFGGPLHLLLC
jgi:hypothetical protein